MSASTLDRRRVFAWCLYDWANSAFPAVITTFVFATYVTEAVAPDPVSGAAAWAGAVADALVAMEIPAVPSGRGNGRDWRLALAAEWRDGAVVPSYAVLNPAGERQGVSEGQPIAMQAWAEASPATLQRAAADAAPGVASLLSRIEAARRQSDPNSLVNRPARIAFSGVTGAPGDGNASLPAQMRTRLAGLGMVVQDTAKDADFSLVGEVRLAPGSKGAQRVEIQWIVEDATGTERGRILQLNEVPPGTLDRHWGDVAVVVAEEAAVLRLPLTLAALREAIEACVVEGQVEPPPEQDRGAPVLH